MIFDEFTLKSQIRAVPDFPKPGVVFRDITPLFQSPRALRMTVDSFVQRYIEADFSHIGAMDARGFLIGSAVAYALNRHRRDPAGGREPGTTPRGQGLRGRGDHRPAGTRRLHSPAGRRHLHLQSHRVRSRRALIRRGAPWRPALAPCAPSSVWSSRPGH